MSFATLKKNRKSAISKMIAAADTGSSSEKKSYVDERQWKPTVDKAGNGYAVIRFLPAPEGNELPWVKYWDHGFKGPTGQWYIEKSLTSIGQQDPVSEMNSKLWATESDEMRAIARERKRRLHYVANILVEQDSGNPENEGKVFLYTFGKKIFDKIMDVMQPQFADEDPINPFDFWEGASFKLKIRKVEGYRNYDKSEFSNASVLSEDDDELEQIYESLYDLTEFTDASSYKTYEELSARLAMVLGGESPRTVKQEVALDTEEVAPVRKATTQRVLAEAPPADDDDDTMSYFAKLAAED